MKLSPAFYISLFVLLTAAIHTTAAATPDDKDIPEGFSISAITDETAILMAGKSYPEAAEKSIPMSNLRHLTLLYVNAEGETCRGEMIVNKAIAKDVLEIFAELYRMKFPIQRMRLIDHYDADDEKSMADNNTSAFCYRAVNSSKRLSKHSLGMAIDINPLYNPCFHIAPPPEKYRRGTLQPANAVPYTDRTKKYPYTITPQVVSLFKKHGFRWGGDWKRKKDYQHFEK
ncbi:MAG: M15 family metallopeptidase [Bacteroidaceae bacterium]|nr:M15 family metallopeptidase [Bacteroidaceae bacterium]